MGVRLRTLLAWCAPCLPVAALSLPLVVYLPPYYAGTLGLPLATVGFLFALVRIVDIPLDPLLGALMDNSRTRIGQFRPWILGGAVFLALGVWMLFMAKPGVSAGMTFLSLFTLYFGFSCISLAQTAWGSRLSTDYAERARIFGYWTALNVFGSILVLVIPPLVNQLMPGSGPAAGIHAMGWYILAAIPLAALAVGLFVPEGEAPVGEHRVRMADVRGVLSDPRMRQLLLADLLLSLAPGLTGALFVFFITQVRGIPLETASGIMLLYFVAGLISAPLWIHAARRFGKHRATAVAAIWYGLVQIPVAYGPADNVLVFSLILIVAGMPLSASGFLLRAMLADLTDAQTLDRQQEGRQGADTTGLNYAILTATAKLGFAVPVGLTYPLLGLIGFDPRPDAANTPEAIAGLTLIFVVPPILIGFAAAYVIWRWPITADAHAAIRARLAAA